MGFRVQGSGFRVSGFGFRLEMPGLALRPRFVEDVHGAWQILSSVAGSPAFLQSAGPEPTLIQPPKPYHLNPHPTIFGGRGIMLNRSPPGLRQMGVGLCMYAASFTDWARSVPDLSGVCG